jgi:hypothetical protein
VSMTADLIDAHRDARLAAVARRDVVCARADEVERLLKSIQWQPTNPHCRLQYSVSYADVLTSAFPDGIGIGGQVFAFWLANPRTVRLYTKHPAPQWRWSMWLSRIGPLRQISPHISDSTWEIGATARSSGAG